MSIIKRLLKLLGLGKVTADAVGNPKGLFVRQIDQYDIRPFRYPYKHQERDLRMLNARWSLIVADAKAWKHYTEDPVVKAFMDGVLE